MTDRELLELAAKAARFKIETFHDGKVVRRDIDGQPIYWNPLEDDADALRLAVKLNLLIQFNAKHVFVFDSCGHQLAFLGKKSDPFAATRRAIVRAAAALWIREGEEKCPS